MIRVYKLRFYCKVYAGHFITDKWGRSSTDSVLIISLRRADDGKKDLISICTLSVIKPKQKCIRAADMETRNLRREPRIVLFGVLKQRQLSTRW